MREDQSNEGGAAGTSHSDLPGTGSEYPSFDPKVCIATACTGVQRARHSATPSQLEFCTQLATQTKKLSLAKY